MNIILKILCFLVFSAVAVSLFTYCFFWYENSGSARRRTLEAEGRSLPGLTLRGIVTGIASLLLLFLLYPLGFVRSLRKPKEFQSSQPVIVLVHGLYHNASAWLLLKYRLRRAGFVNVYAINYSSIFTSFDNALEKLGKFVQRLPAPDPSQPVIIIGHSLGGLLARAYAEKTSPSSAPAAIITLGTPHKGSRMAAFGFGRLARDILYEGELFSRLGQGSETLPCPAFALISPADALVLPYDGLEPPAGWIVHETQPMSHISMLYSGTVAGKIIELIKK